MREHLLVYEINGEITNFYSKNEGIPCYIFETSQDFKYTSFVLE